MKLMNRIKTKISNIAVKTDVNTIYYGNYRAGNRDDFKHHLFGLISVILWKICGDKKENAMRRTRIRVGKLDKERLGKGLGSLKRILEEEMSTIKKIK